MNREERLRGSRLSLRSKAPAAAAEAAPLPDTEGCGAVIDPTCVWPPAPDEALGAATLLNLGSTCYLNVVVQVLRRAPKLRAAMSRALARGAQRGGVLEALSRLMESMAAAEAEGGALSPLSPAVLLHRLRGRHAALRPVGQHCALETLSCLLESLEEEDCDGAGTVGSGGRGTVVSSGEGGASPGDAAPHRLLSGEMTNSIRCLECEHVTTHCETFHELSLPFPPQTQALQPPPVPPAVLASRSPAVLQQPSPGPPHPVSSPMVLWPSATPKLAPTPSTTLTPPPPPESPLGPPSVLPPAPPPVLPPPPVKGPFPIPPPPVLDCPPPPWALRYPTTARMPVEHTPEPPTTSQRAPASQRAPMDAGDS